MSGYRTINRNKYGGGRRDAKEISRQRKEIVALDPDIGGRDDLEDDDVDQSRVNTRIPRVDVTSSIRNNLAIRQANQLMNSGAGNRNRSVICTQVTVRNAAQSGLKHVLKSIGSYMDNFRPIAAQVREQDIEFFIADDKEAEAVRALSRRIVDKRHPNSRFIIQTRKAAAPWPSLDRRIRDMIVNVLSKRYNKALNLLDLSDFGADKDFTSNKIIVSLTRNDVLVAIFDMIEKEYSHITSLSLKDNRLRSLVFMSSIVFRCKNVKELDISGNEFKNIDDLERLGLWNIEKLLLENNPFCMNYTDADTYTRDVHKHIPTVSYLDGINVTPSSMPVENRSSLLPKPRLSYCDSDAVKRVVEKFLQEYISIYDSLEPETARKALMAAYSDQAEFSFCINTLEHHTQSRGDIDTYSAYMRNSRNIVFEDKWASNPDRVRYKGSMDIAVQLAKLPSTKHLVETFILDIDFYIDSLCGFTLRGLFIDGSERDSPRPNYKLFMRNFLVVSTGEGTMAILCDTLQICPISTVAADSYRDMLTNAALEASNLPGPSGLHQPTHANITGVPAIVVTAAPPPTPQPIDANVKLQMIRQFSAQTGMNVDYSKRCLEDNNYDYEAAGQRFMEIRSQIPPDAFH